MVKFILLGHARIGSTLLVASLMEHPQVHLFGELFNTVSEAREQAFSFGLRPSEASAPHASVGPIDEKLFYQSGEDAAVFIEQRAFYPHANESVAVGFKIFYHQAHDTRGAEKAWEYLFAHPEIRVIHLSRRNLLESFLSLRIAFQTDEWTRPKGEAAPRRELPPQHLPVTECAEYFAEIKRQRELARHGFRHHQVMEIEYERDICRNFQETLHRIQAFLDVPCRAARQLLEKQAQHKPWEQISNYSELKEHFRHSAYAELFE
jgi:LPS sulfotransferase NodH